MVFIIEHSGRLNCGREFRLTQAFREVFQRREFVFGEFEGGFEGDGLRAEELVGGEGEEGGETEELGNGGVAVSCKPPGDERFTAGAVGGDEGDGCVVEDEDGPEARPEMEPWGRGGFGFLEFHAVVQRLRVRRKASARWAAAAVATKKMLLK